MPVKGSTNYVWFTDQLLGQGATGNVYKGRHKKKGDLCAVKIIIVAGQSRLSAIQKRELDVMKRLEHPNIVKLLGVEEESQSKEKVMIMELCQGGSLYSLLEEPQNNFGVNEDEFLTVLKDIALGMEYLHQQGVVHRDVKPGNILRCITDDERSIYKLTDFGGARELKFEEESFMSMFGTEEYLHPDMYERALLNGPKDRQFDATVDLWSVGVTLYHVATGQLPFRPFGGRKNKSAMHLITSKKDPGVISGVQQSLHGVIEYSKVLPATCRLSNGLKTKIVPIIGGLLENDARLKYTFDNFFKEVKHLCANRSLYVFSIPTFTHLRVYAPPNARLSHIQDQLAEQTEIPAQNQVLIFKGNMLDDIIDPLNDPVSSYPPTTRCSPIIIFTSNDNWLITKPRIPDVPESPDQTAAGDSHLAKRCCGLMYYMHFILEDILLGQNLLKEAASHICNLTQAWFKGTRGLIGECWKTVDETLKRTHYLETCIQDRLDDWSPEYRGNQPADFVQHYSLVCNHMRRELEDLRRFSASIKENKEKVQKYNASLFEKFNKMIKTMSTQLNLNDREDHWIARSQTYVKDMSRIHIQFKEDRKKALSYNEDQIHKYERYKIKEICGCQEKLYSSILNDHLFPLHKKAKSNISLLWKYREKISAVQKEGGKIDDDTTQLSKALDTREKDLKKKLGELRQMWVRPGGSAVGHLHDVFNVGRSSGYGSDPLYRTAAPSRDSGIQTASVVHLPSDPSLSSCPSASSQPEGASNRSSSDGPAIRMLELKECLTRLSDQSQSVKDEMNKNTDIIVGFQGEIEASESSEMSDTLMEVEQSELR